MKQVIIRLLVCFIPFTKVRRSVRDRLFDAFVYKPENLKKYQEIKAKWQTKNNAGKLLPGRFDEYDLVFAIGVACPMTWELIAHKLRTFSNPFDWTDGVPKTNWMLKANVWRDTRFIEKIQALCADFKDFFNKEDIKIVSSGNADLSEHHTVHNIRTKIRFLHLFPINESIENKWNEISLKIKRRSERLVDKINSSNRVLICWGHRIMCQKDSLDSPVSDFDIKKAVRLLNKKFPHADIDLVFFEHDGTKKDFEYDKITVCDGAYRIVSNHCIVTDSYKTVCAPVILNGIRINRPETIVIAEALDNIKLSQKS